MNPQKFHEVAEHYIAAFDEINNVRNLEYYKWQIAKKFRPAIEDALVAPDANLPRKLYDVKKLTANLIDSYTQPFNGLVNFSKKEPDTVRKMFQELFAVTKADVTSKEEAIYQFLDKSLALREKYYPDSFLYKDDLHSVTGYLFLYDPDHNYLYKATHCREFADCIEFYDDWGSGADTKLDVFYRMCDECVAEIKKNPALLETAESRLTIDPEGMHPDTEKHILLFDMIYCSSRNTYNLLKDIHYIVPKSKERQLMQERKEKALELKQLLNEAQGQTTKLEEVINLLSAGIEKGKTVRHKTFGVGTIAAVNENLIRICFEKNGDKELGVKQSIMNGLLTVDGLDLTEEQIALLKDERKTQSALSFAEKAIAPYAEYLD